MQQAHHANKVSSTTKGGMTNNPNFNLMNSYGGHGSNGLSQQMAPSSVQANNSTGIQFPNGNRTGFENAELS
jgi:hypothetical protein